jgi:hypothetical protein
MLYLKQRNIIFIKPRKVAGTSVEIALTCNAGEQDIITPISLVDELTRMRLGGVLPSGWAYNGLSERLYRMVCRAAYKRQEALNNSGRPGVLQPVIDDVIQRMLALKNPKYRSADLPFYQGLWGLVSYWRRFYNHIPPHKIIQELGADTFWNAHKITICRHPYDQLLSRAYFTLSRKHDPSLDVQQIINNMLNKKSENDHFYQLDGRKTYDTLIRYEHLRSDLLELEQRFGLTLLEKLPFTKHTSRTDRTPAHEVLTREQRQKCYERNRLEFELFGYDPYL